MNDNIIFFCKNFPEIRERKVYFTGGWAGKTIYYKDEWGYILKSGKFFTKNQLLENGYIEISECELALLL